MRHCSTASHFSGFTPGYTTPRARRFGLMLREHSVRYHFERMPEWLPWDAEYVTEQRFNRGPGLVVVTRCKNGHLTTVIHTTDEPYPRP